MIVFEKGRFGFERKDLDGVGAGGIDWAVGRVVCVKSGVQD